MVHPDRRVTNLPGGPLSPSEEFADDADPENSSILLVSAPGAVGKSTLAREIAHATGSIYIDLAEAAPVGAQTLTGGLARSGLFEAWESESVAALIDGLDEARLKVTHEAFRSFLSDIAELSVSRTIPTVLFGRTRAIQDAWLELAESDIDVSISVLEIGYFDPQSSLALAVNKLNPSSQHTSVQTEVMEVILQTLRRETSSDGDRFAGYAPVIEAVAAHVNDEDNPGALLARVRQGDQPVSMQAIVSAILDRDHRKLRAIEFKDKTLSERLYTPDEQLDRLVSEAYGAPPPEMPDMDPEDAQRYEGLLEEWVNDHPFRDASATVFDAVISTRGLQSTAASGAALNRELGRSVANPFLSEFYALGSDLIQPEHVGVFYASVRARLALGDSASLYLGTDEESRSLTEMEITITRRDTSEPRILRLQTEESGTIILGSQVEDIHLAVPWARVTIGAEPEATLVAPVIIQCNELFMPAPKLIIEAPDGRHDNAVLLEAQEYLGRTSQVPVIRGDVSLSASWPGVATYPWTAFAINPTSAGDEDPELDEALRRFRNFVIQFRSNRYGGLARYQGTIDNTRMTKGPGRAVLRHMEETGILTRQQPMYFLDPQRLSELTGTSYADCMARRFGEKAVSFVREAMSSG